MPELLASDQQTLVEQSQQPATLADLLAQVDLVKHLRWFKWLARLIATHSYQSNLAAVRQLVGLAKPQLVVRLSLVELQERAKLEAQLDLLQSAIVRLQELPL